MTGSAPVPTVTGAAPIYAPGAPVQLTLTVADADTRVDEMDTTGTAADGTAVQVHETRSYVDTATVQAAWATNPATLIVTDNGDGTYTIAGTAPAASDTVLITIGDAQGNTIPVDVPITVVSPLLFGIDPKPTDRAGHLAMYPGAAVVSAFADPGSGLPLPPTLPAGVILHQRVKDPVTAALVNPWLDALTKRAWLTWHHEPKTTDDPAAHKASQVALRQLVDAHPNGHLVDLVGNFMLSQIRDSGMRWQDYWASMPDGTPACDMIGFDCYVNVSKATLEDPASLFSVPLAAAREAGVPLSISELGAMVVPTKPGRTAAKHTAWLVSCVAFLRARPEVRAVCYWCNTGSQGDFHLDHTAPGSLAVWQAACAGM